MSAYIKIAGRYELLDNINSRSSHSIVTIRGGGLVIPLSILFYATYHLEANVFYIGPYKMVQAKG